MIESIAKKRLNNVVMVDSINSTPADFLATHVPFKKIVIKNGLNTDSFIYQTENEFYEHYFCDANIYNNHQFIIVEGSAGTGKSHFIRWLNAKLNSSGRTDDVILLIKRDDNTLKGTIKQLLTIPEVKSLKNKDAYDRLVKADKILSDENKLKNQIYGQFIIDIKSDNTDDIFSTREKKKLVALLSEGFFEDRMMSINGPVDRIFSKIRKSENTNLELTAEFTKEDFLLDTEFMHQFDKFGPSKFARDFALNLLPEDDGDSCAEDLAKYMNSLIDGVIQSCSGIEPGDFQTIFKEIRQELYKQKKNLILLIEDITSCTGINKALLNVLVTGHTGMYEVDCMCRLISVVGTTSQYYSTFRDNYKDRITTQITIEDGAIGSNHNDLYEFFGKYLNAISLESDVLRDWYNEGANNESIPLYNDTKLSYWDSYSVNGMKFNLYPFTKKSIINMYSCMESQKTPRHILTEIFTPCINEILYAKDNFLASISKRKTKINEEVDHRLRNIVSGFDLSQEDKNNLSSRLVAFVGLYADNSQQKNSTYGIDNRIWKEFGFEKILEKLSGENEYVVSDEPVNDDTKTDEKPKENVKYNEFYENLSNWFYKKTIFSKSLNIKEEINKFIINTLDWQQNEIPLSLVNLVESSNKDIVGFERQERGLDNALVILDDSDETRQLLLAMGKYLYLGNKSWDFEDSNYSIYFLTSWLERNKKKIIEAVVGENYKNAPLYIKCALSNYFYYLLFTGQDYSKKNSVELESIIKPMRNITSIDGHSKTWNDLIQFMNNKDKISINRKYLFDYYSLTQGSSLDGIKVINYLELKDLFNFMKRNSFEFEIEDIAYTKDKNEIVSLYDGIKSRFNKVVLDEKNDIAYCLKEIYEVFGFDDDDDIEADDIRDILGHAKRLYSDSKNYSFLINDRSEIASSLYNQSEEICKCINDSKNVITCQNDTDCLFKLSSNPLKIVKSFVQFLKLLESDLSQCEKQVNAEIEKQKTNGTWSENGDTRFDEKKDDYLKAKEVILNVVDR